MLAFSAKMADNCSWKYSTSYIIYLLQLLFADFWHKEKGTINEVCVFKTICVSTDRQNVSLDQEIYHGNQHVA